MRLCLDLPHSFVEVPLGHGAFEVASPDHPWLTIEIRPLVVAAVDRALWYLDLLAAPVGAHTKVLGATASTTSSGWPVEIVDAFVSDGTTLIAHHLIAAYHMLGHTSAVIARSPDHERFAAGLKPLLLPLLATAWPDWGSAEPVTLAELWSLARGDG